MPGPASSSQALRPGLANIPDDESVNPMPAPTNSQRPRLVSTEGSPVIVGRRDKQERIREALTDLELAIDGCIAQQSGQSGQLGQSIAALARGCSVFLRKMVVEDRETRLLDADVCRSAGLGFDRIKKVPGGRRALSLVPLDIRGGHTEITKLNDDTWEPEAVYVFPVGPQRLEIAIEWPLPGMTDWTEQPTTERPWAIKSEGLFGSQSSQMLDCDAWPGQQLVIFDNRGISLKEVIKLTVNTEGAHSPPVSRLMRAEGDDKSKVAKNRDDVRVLSHIEVCGVRYTHAIVIEAALYLYRALTRYKSIWQPQGEVSVPVFCFVPSDVFSPDQDWLRFDGGLAMSLGGAKQSISHRVRAPR